MYVESFTRSWNHLSGIIQVESFGVIFIWSPFEMTPNDSKWNDSKWLQLIPNESKWLHFYDSTYVNSLRWSHLHDSNSPFMTPLKLTPTSKMTPNDSKWLQMTPVSAAEGIWSHLESFGINLVFHISMTPRYSVSSGSLFTFSTITLVFTPHLVKYLASSKKQVHFGPLRAAKC